MKYSNEPFYKALKEIMEKKDIVHRKLAAKTNFSFSYFCVLKKRKNNPPVETIKIIASGLGIPPEYFLEYRIDKLIRLLMDNPAVTDDVFNLAYKRGAHYFFKSSGKSITLNYIIYYINHSF